MQIASQADNVHLLVWVFLLVRMQSDINDVTLLDVIHDLFERDVTLSFELLIFVVIPSNGFRV